MRIRGEKTDQGQNKEISLSKLTLSDLRLVTSKRMPRKKLSPSLEIFKTHLDKVLCSLL